MITSVTETKIETSVEGHFAKLFEAGEWHVWFVQADGRKTFEIEKTQEAAISRLNILMGVVEAGVDFFPENNFDYDFGAPQRTHAEIKAEKLAEVEQIATETNAIVIDMTDANYEATLKSLGCTQHSYDHEIYGWVTVWVDASGKDLQIIGEFALVPQTNNGGFSAAFLAKVEADKAAFVEVKVDHHAYPIPSKDREHLNKAVESFRYHRSLACQRYLMLTNNEDVELSYRMVRQCVELAREAAGTVMSIIPKYDKWDVRRLLPVNRQEVIELGELLGDARHVYNGESDKVFRGAVYARTYTPKS